MSGLTCREICHLFCCPPCPSRIAAKLAFVPPTSTYQIVPKENQNLFELKLTEYAEWQYSIKELQNIEMLTTRTKRGVQIACMYVKYPGIGPKSKYTLLFSHGNAVDLGQMSSFYIGLSSRLGVNIFSYDYSGYGVSGGQPSEKNICADIEAAYTILMHRYSVLPENIILYGQSIGTVPTIDLARNHDCAAVVLHSPLMSGMRVAFPNTKRTWFFDAFPNIEKINKVKAPVLVIHGKEDEVVDFSHGLGIFKQCPKAVEPLWVEGAGHNDIELHPEYVERLTKFIHLELPN